MQESLVTPATFCPHYQSVWCSLDPINLTQQTRRHNRWPITGDRGGITNDKLRRWGAAVEGSNPRLHNVPDLSNTACPALCPGPVHACEDIWLIWSPQRLKAGAECFLSCWAAACWYGTFWPIWFCSFCSVKLLLCKVIRATNTLCARETNIAPRRR